MFYDINDSNIARYADDNTPYTSSSNLGALLNKLEESTNNLFQWFRNNYMKANLTNAIFWLKVTMKSLQILMNLKLKAVKKKKYWVHQLTPHFLLSIIFHLCKKARQKLHGLARTAHYMDFKKRRSLMKPFAISQFKYCPLMWMLHNRALTNRINGIHK